MASSKVCSSEDDSLRSRATRECSELKSPLQRLLSRGIPMPGLDGEQLAMFTPEERRALAQGACEQCEANR